MPELIFTNIAYRKVLNEMIFLLLRCCDYCLFHKIISSRFLRLYHFILYMAQLLILRALKKYHLNARVVDITVPSPLEIQSHAAYYW